MLMLLRNISCEIQYFGGTPESPIAQRAPRFNLTRMPQLVEPVITEKSPETPKVARRNLLYVTTVIFLSKTWACL